MHGWMNAVWAASMTVTVVTPVLAQSSVKDVEPYIAVVTTDKVAMRGGDAAFMYPVRELKSGELVRITGEGPGWMRAEYLPGMRAYVAASDAELAKDGRTVKLVRQSQLMAFDASPNPKAPWWPLDLPKPLDAGTVLDVLSTQKASDDVVQGYVVPAPANARGYIGKDHVRKATADEAARFIGASPAQPAEASKPVETPVKPVEPGVKSAEATPKPAETSATTTGAPTGFAPVTPVSTTPATSVGTGPAATSTTTTTAMPQPRVVPPQPPKPTIDEELAQLRTMFEKTMASKDDGELPVVIGMFENKVAKLGAAPAEQNMKTQLGQRLQALRLRQEIIAEAQRAKSVAEQSASRVTEVTLTVEQAQRQAIYTVVGRIVPSTVYDGKRGLPLMYRVQSADALAPRTVGYILPQETLDLTGKLGQVCGVVGETRFDDSLGLNIVAPRRIDVLGVSASATTPGSAQQPVTVPTTTTVTVPTEGVPAGTPSAPEK